MKASEFSSESTLLNRHETGEQNFTGANLNGVDLSGHNLNRINLSAAHLNKANLTKDKLFRAILCNA